MEGCVILVFNMKKIVPTTVHEAFVEVFEQVCEEVWADAKSLVEKNDIVTPREELKRLISNRTRELFFRATEGDIYDKDESGIAVLNQAVSSLSIALGMGAPSEIVVTGDSVHDTEEISEIEALPSHLFTEELLGRIRPMFEAKFVGEEVRRDNGNKQERNIRSTGTRYAPFFGNGETVSREEAYRSHEERLIKSYSAGNIRQ